jgi:hypothetical protein
MAQKRRLKKYINDLSHVLTRTLERVAENAPLSVAFMCN